MLLSCLAVAVRGPVVICDFPISLPQPSAQIQAAHGITRRLEANAHRVARARIPRLTATSTTALPTDTAPASEHSHISNKAPNRGEDTTQNRWEQR